MMRKEEIRKRHLERRISPKGARGLARKRNSVFRQEYRVKNVAAVKPLKYAPPDYR